jgi:hypothetical protein
VAFLNPIKNEGKKEFKQQGRKRESGDKDV